MQADTKPARRARIRFPLVVACEWQQLTGVSPGARTKTPLAAGETRDVSAHGALVRAAACPPLRAAILLRVVVAGSMLTARGRVVRLQQLERGAWAFAVCWHGDGGARLEREREMEVATAA